jgi:DtxR family Mn-dependent transcriptional regulator
MSNKPEYLLAIYIEENRGTPPVSFDRIGERLDKSPATVTEMCQRLDDEDLLRYDQYRGVTLTDRGTEIAASHHERYVILSWFFRSLLELEDYEREAMRMASAVSPEVANRLAATLPYTDHSDTPPEHPE